MLRLLILNFHYALLVILKEGSMMNGRTLHLITLKAIEDLLKCNAMLTLRHTPFPNAELRGHMESVAKRIGFPQQALAHD